MADSYTRTDTEKFIRVVMRSATIAAAAKELGCSPQAVSKRLAAYRKAGVTGLPEFNEKRIDAKSVQAMVNKHKGGK